MILYKTTDGQVEIQLKAVEGTVWLIQEEIAQLFDKGRSTIAEHIQNIFQDKELSKDSVCRDFRRTASDGKPYNMTHYNLDMILAVGYRVNSSRGIQFRKWAATVLKEYLVKGFAMDDERLKRVKKWDYFDEWLERIREIRASEKRFYQKVKDIYATAIDYDRESEQAKLFFKKVQNKMLWTITGKTAAELIVDRSSIEKLNMGLTSWQGSRVRKGDVVIAKNYLKKKEISELNRIVTMYLDYAEDQANNRRAITMKQWNEKLDAFLRFNERDLLTHAGAVKAEVAKTLVESRYETFSLKRRKAEAFLSDMKDLKEIEQLAKQLKKNVSDE